MVMMVMPGDGADHKLRVYQMAETENKCES
jgi:hypothetical protein